MTHFICFVQEEKTRLPIFVDEKGRFHLTKTQAIVGALRRLLSSSCPAGVPGQKNRRHKTHEFEWVPNGQEGFFSTWVQFSFGSFVLTLYYRAPGDHPFGVNMGSFLSVECVLGFDGVALRYWKNGLSQFSIFLVMKVVPDHHHYCVNNWEKKFRAKLLGQHPFCWAKLTCFDIILLSQTHMFWLFHFAEPNWYVLTFFHSILICRVTYWAPLLLKLLFFNRRKSGTWWWWPLKLKEDPH